MMSSWINSIGNTPKFWHDDVGVCGERTPQVITLQ